jgi:hypothetical protein
MTMSDSYYRDGSLIVVVRTGQPQDAVRIGLGDDYPEAIANLEATGVKSTGRDNGEASALAYAHNNGWISDPNDLEPDDGPDFDALVAEVESAAEAAAHWTGWEWAHDPGGHGIVVTGPGAVKNWDLWERAQRRKLTARDIDDSERMTRSEIRETLDAVAAAMREYGETAQAAATEAAELGEQAVSAARKGYYKKALDFAKQASRLEAEYGDDPSYAPLLTACEALVAVTY